MPDDARLREWPRIIIDGRLSVISKNVKDYAAVVSPCCGVLLQRPYTGRDCGDFFCADCGDVYNVHTFEGNSTIRKVEDEK